MRDGHARVWQPLVAPASPEPPAVHVAATGRWNASRLQPGARAFCGLAAAAAGVGGIVQAAPALGSDIFHGLLWAVFGCAAGVRLGAVAASRRPALSCPGRPARLPSYTVIAPMYREPAVAAQLVEALKALNYPHDRLQILLVLEADDPATWGAVKRLRLEPPFEVFVAPSGWPRTKPRACNEALAHARGEFVVIYDAEDRPHPGQLLEAAGRFVREPRLACLQAPLRVDGARCFLQRQFALEYAAQFEVMLPALHRLGLPFPLGGSSNHFRTSVLRGLGGWDAFNVTEDADVGFRLAAARLHAGLLRTPTYEQAPDSLRDWLPQRARWLKGWLQTWCVHMRRPGLGGWRRFAALQATLGLGLLSAFGHGPLLALLVAETLWPLLSGAPPRVPNLLLASVGWVVALGMMSTGARRAGLRLGLRDALLAPLYWPLHSLAAVRALAQWFTRPFHWDKTEHRPVA